LQTAWAFWFDKKCDKRSPSDFESGMVKLGSFDSVEDFWRHYVHMQKPSLLPVDTNYYLFRDNFFPAWESFPDGGCWILKVKRRPGVLGKLWQDLVFATIGEMFEEPAVVGVMLAVRSYMDMLSIWLSNSGQSRFAVGEKLKRILHLEIGAVLDFKVFRDSIRDGSTFRNAKSFMFAQRPTGNGGGGPRMQKQRIMQRRQQKLKQKERLESMPPMNEGASLVANDE